MAFSITLNELRTQYQDEIETDPKTGIRYTVDSQGNPLVFAPTKEIPSETPGAPSGFEYESLAPESRTFTDPSGKEVTLAETDIRPYLFDPGLAQRESDLALISGKAGSDVPPIGTELTRGKEWEDRPGEKKTFIEPETGFTKLMPGVEPVDERDLPEEEKQKIQAASQRIDQEAGVTPPGGPGLPETGDIDWFDPKLRDNYKAHIEQKMGGNPNTINPQEEVMKLMPDSKVQTWYADNWVDGMPTWYDLSKSAQAQIGMKLRSDLLSQYKREIAAKSEVYNQLMADFDKKQADHQKALKYIQGMMKEQKKEVRARAKEEETALYRLNRSKANKEKIQKTLDESFSDEEKIRLQDQLKSADEEVRHFQTLVDQAKPKLKGGAGDKKNPISTAPAWAGKFVADKKIDPKDYVRSTTDEHGQYVEIMEDGKKVRYGLEKGSKEWVKMTPGKQKISE